jgi:hypothetical protein
MSAKLTLTNASAREGAQMGRRNELPADPAAPCKLRLHRLAMQGDYDEGGAYWGGGPSAAGVTWVAWNVDGVRVFTRNRTREEARAAVLRLVPGATFWR